MAPLLQIYIHRSKRWKGLNSGVYKVCFTPPLDVNMIKEKEEGRREGGGKKGKGMEGEAKGKARGKIQHIITPPPHTHKNGASRYFPLGKEIKLKNERVGKEIKLFATLYTPGLDDIKVSKESLFVLL